MTVPLAGFYSNPGNIDRRTNSFVRSSLRNSFHGELRKRSWTMSAHHVRETLLPASAFACSVAFVLAVVLFS